MQHCTNTIFDFHGSKNVDSVVFLDYNIFNVENDGSKSF